LYEVGYYDVIVIGGCPSGGGNAPKNVVIHFGGITGFPEDCPAQVWWYLAETIPTANGRS